MEDQYSNYVLELMKTGILFLKNAKLKPKVYNLKEDPFRSLLVYNLREMKNDMWLPLNRDYIPLGLIGDGWADYENEKYNHLLIHKANINFDLLWDNQPQFFTFSDSTYPEGKYLQRYIDIIEHAFFGNETDMTFEKAWGYKNKISMYKENYEYNLSRFKK